MTALQFYESTDLVGRTFRLNPLRGRLRDMLGGRTRLPSFPPTETDAMAKKSIRRIRWTRQPLWLRSYQDEYLGDRLARIARAFRNVGDLLG